MSTGRAIPFYKLSGGGNDFVALVEPAAPPTAREVRAWCRRGLSLGADGVFVLAPGGPDGADVTMTHHNPDGSVAELCLNGTRCAVRLALDLGWGAGDRLRIATGAGTFDARHVGPEETEVELPPPVAAPAAVAPEAAGRAWRGWSVVVGVPHFVVFWDGDLDAAPVDEAGPPLRRHPLFGDAGANVDFVRVDGRDAFAIRTYERGVEDETLACGTGVMASVAAGLAAGRLDLPCRATTAGGFTFRIDGEPDAFGRPARWSLAGDARVLARGEILAGAGSAPTARSS